MSKIVVTDVKHPQKEKYVYQYGVTFSATLIIFSCGVAAGWPSPSLPKLMNKNSNILITSDESSWIISCIFIGGIFSPFPAVWMMDRFGRKIALITIALPSVMGWFLIGIANSVAMLYMAMLLHGLTFGWVNAVLPIYLGEIASDKIRGSLGLIITVMNRTGNLYSFAIAPYVSTSAMGWISMIPAICFLATFPWLPESPYFLLGKNMTIEAQTSLSKLRRHDDVIEELEIMKTTIEFSQPEEKNFKEIFSRDNKTRLIVMIGLALAPQLCGSTAILSYGETIFVRVGSKLGASETNIVLGIVQLLTAMLSFKYVDSWGRKPLLLISITGAAVCNTIVGLYFMLEERYNIDVSSVAWISVVAMMGFIFFVTFGVCPLPYVILGEIFPNNLKAIASVVCCLMTPLGGMIAVKCFQVVSDDLGNDVIFFGFSFFAVLFIPLFYYLLPETKAKSLAFILKEIDFKKH